MGYFTLNKTLRNQRTVQIQTMILNTQSFPQNSSPAFNSTPHTLAQREIQGERGLLSGSTAGWLNRFSSKSTVWETTHASSRPHCGLPGIDEEGGGRQEPLLILPGGPHAGPAPIGPVPGTGLPSRRPVSQSALRTCSGTSPAGKGLEPCIRREA